MIFKKKLHQLIAGDFFRDVMKLSAGTLIGRLITIATLPFISRMYDPQDFSSLAVVMSVVSLCGVVACLRLEIAIPLADNEEDSANLFVIALSFSAAVAAVVAFILHLTIQLNPAILKSIGLLNYWWLVPLGVLMSSGYNASQYWATRYKRFDSVARTRVTQAVTGAATTLGFGWYGLGTLGLILGNILQISWGVGRLLRDAVVQDKKLLTNVTLKGMQLTFRTHARYPKYSTPEALANVGGLQIPIILIAASSPTEAGFLFLTMQVLNAPMTLLGRSVSQVYLSNSREKMTEGNLAAFTQETLYQLVFWGVIPLCLLSLLAPPAFPIIFGDDWFRAGQLITVVTPWMALQLLASPISMVMHAKQRSRAMLGLTLSGGVFRVICVTITLYFSPHLAIHALGVSSAIFYGICLIIFGRVSGIGNTSDTRKLIALLSLILIAFCILSLTI